MPRGIKNVVDFPTQLQQLNDKIEKHQQTIIDLKAKRDELLAKKQEADMSELSTFMQNNNLSAADVLAMLNPPAMAASGTAATQNV